MYTYDKGRRLVCGCIPFRVTKTHQIEVALISNRTKEAWIFPKVRSLLSCLLPPNPNPVTPNPDPNPQSTTLNHHTTTPSAGLRSDKRAVGSWTRATSSVQFVSAKRKRVYGET